MFRLFIYHLTNRVKKTLKLLLSIFGQFTCTSEGNFFFIIKFYICCCTWEKSGRRNEPFNATKRCHYFHIIIFNFKHFSHKYIWVERRFLVHFIFRNPPKSQAPIFQPHPKEGKALFQTVDKRTGVKISNQFEKLKLVWKIQTKGKIWTTTDTTDAKSISFCMTTTIYKGQFKKLTELSKTAGHVIIWSTFS